MLTDPDSEKAGRVLQAMLKMNKNRDRPLEESVRKLLKENYLEERFTPSKPAIT
jgi:hypothetical protein